MLGELLTDNFVHVLLFLLIALAAFALLEGPAVPAATPTLTFKPTLSPRVKDIVLVKLASLNGPEEDVRFWVVCGNKLPISGSIRREDVKHWKIDIGKNAQLRETFEGLVVAILELSKAGSLYLQFGEEEELVKATVV